MQAKVENLNLDNFNQSSNKQPILTSPRSLEACRRQGINPEDLIIKNIEDMKIIYPDKIKDKKHLDVKLAYYEEKRKQKLQLAKDERVVLKELEKQGLLAFNESGFAKHGPTKSSTLKILQLTKFSKARKVINLELQLFSAPFYNKNIQIWVDQLSMDLNKETHHQLREKRSNWKRLGLDKQQTLD